MTQAGRETSSTERRASLFVSGIVLGVAAGIAAGHLFVFSRSNSPESTSTAEEEFAQLVASSPHFSGEPQAPVSSESAYSILEFDGQEEVGRVKLSDLSSDDDYLHFFPEAMSPPASEIATSAIPRREQTLMSASPLQMTADVAASSDAQPQTLRPPLAAAPINEATSDRQRLARAIIQEELPEATPQERDVWYEVLQGLPADDIKGILRMRKHIGPRQMFELCPPQTTLAPLALAPDHASTATAPSRGLEPEADVVVRLRQLTEHNVANRQTVAFKQWIPVLVEAAAEDPAGVAISRVIRDMRQGALEPTGRALDLAVDGPGFLQVRCGDEVRFTRDGRLCLDEQRRLMLLAPAEAWLIDPPIEIPPEAIDVVVSATRNISAILPDQSESSLGTLRLVRFLDPSALSWEHEGLYQATPGSGAPQEVDAASEAPTRLVQRQLERSNVSLSETRTGSVGVPPERR